MLEKYKSLNLKPEMQYFIRKLISENPSKKKYILKTLDLWIERYDLWIQFIREDMYTDEKQLKMSDFPLKWYKKRCRDLTKSNGIVDIRIIPAGKKFRIVFHPIYTLFDKNNQFEFPIKKEYYSNSIFDAMEKAVNLQKEIDEQYFKKTGVQYEK